LKLEFIRGIDYYLGPIIVRFFLFIKTLYGFFSRSSSLRKRKVRNVLVVKFFGMGSTLLFSPVLDSIKKEHPSARISFLTLSANKNECGILPSIDETLCLNLDTYLSFFSSFVKVIRHVRRQHYDIIIDLEFLTNFSALVTLLASPFSRRLVVIGFNSPLKWRNNVHTINVSFSHSSHITDIFLKITQCLGLKENKYIPELTKKALVKAADKSCLHNEIKNNPDLKSCDFIAIINIHTGELCLQRRWPKEYFAQVVNTLLERNKTLVVLIGGKNDIKYTNLFKRMVQASPRLVDLCGKLTFEGLAGILLAGNVLITNDSGPLHLAAIMGVPTISFFGPETPSLYGPINGKHHVFYANRYCSPCLNIYNSKASSCNNNKCLKAIKPHEALQVVNKMIVQ